MTARLPSCQGGRTLIDACHRSAALSATRADRTFPITPRFIFPTVGASESNL